MDAIIKFFECLGVVFLFLAVVVVLIAGFDHLLRETRNSKDVRLGSLGHYAGCLDSLLTHLERGRERK